MTFYRPRNRNQVFMRGVVKSFALVMAAVGVCMIFVALSVSDEYHAYREEVVATSGVPLDPVADRAEMRVILSAGTAGFVALYGAAFLWRGVVPGWFGRFILALARKTQKPLPLPPPLKRAA